MLRRSLGAPGFHAGVRGSIQSAGGVMTTSHERRIGRVLISVVVPAAVFAWAVAIAAEPQGGVTPTSVSSASALPAWAFPIPPGRGGGTRATAGSARGEVPPGQGAAAARTQGPG